MKKTVCVIFAMVVVITSVVIVGKPAPKASEKQPCFFLSSLHHTTEGMRHWYSKENGGVEIISGIPYDEIGCKNCHAEGCDRCHKIEREGRVAYSVEAAKKQSVCLSCHGRARSMIKIDKAAQQEDLHFAQGMTCMDCHSAREIHGDGNEYISLKQPGAMDTRCENCHVDVEETTAHTIHNGKLDCQACHVRHVVSCANCHIDTFVKSGKKKAIKLSEWMFLLNYQGKVTSANMQTFVAGGNKTFLMFAPHMSHSIMNRGRACEACHGTANVNQVKNGKVILTWFDDGKVQNLKGVIPVVDGVDYQCVYLNYANGKWNPIENPEKPVYHYPSFGKPLSKGQLNSLLRRQRVSKHENE